jgi:transcriptional regulator NrdR family protein
MICPECESSDTLAAEKRTHKKIRAASRRRVCRDCGCRFETVESIGHVKVKNGEGVSFEIYGYTAD